MARILFVALAVLASFAVGIAASGCSAPVSPSPEGKPDLVIKSVEYPAVAYRGSWISVTVTIENIGGSSTTNRYSGSSTVHFYLSDDKLDVSSDTWIGGIDFKRLEPDETIMQRGKIFIPKWKSDGVYHLVADADGARDVEELNESNNVFLADTINVLTPDIDLQIGDVSAEVNEESVTVTYQVINAGNQPAYDIEVNLYAVSEEGRRPIGASQIIPLLEAGASINSVNSFPLPWWAENPTRIEVKVDAFNSIVEQDESNNSSLSFSG